MQAVGQIRVLVGTRKGAFIYSSDEGREKWKLSEPMLQGWQVHHMAADRRREPTRLYAAANHAVWGPAVAKSDDGGKTWDVHSRDLGFPQDMGVTINTVWHVRPGHESQPGVVYCGTVPAGLFRSEDWGVSWTAVDGINRHPLRSAWQPAGGGLALHSIEIDPRNPGRMYLAISAGGSYVSDDGGRTWRLFSYDTIDMPTTEQFISQLEASVPPGVDPAAVKQFISQLEANVPANVDPAAVFDMHRMRLDPKNPDRLWVQAHTGVFRSDDGGRSWEDVTAGLPSFHGFPIAVARRAPDAAYVVPLQADAFRVCPGQFTLYRTRDGGRSWQALSNGLPGPGDYQSVYREGLDTDGLDPEGVYVGTSNGQVFASADGGDRWQRLPGTLPPVLSVTCAAF